MKNLLIALIALTMTLGVGCKKSNDGITYEKLKKDLSIETLHKGVDVKIMTAPSAGKHDDLCKCHECRETQQNYPPK